MNREAMKLALEALEANQPVNYCMNNSGEKFPMMQEDPFRFDRNTKAITALREALAPQPAQQFTEDAPADCKRLAEHGAPICGRCHMGPCKYTAPQAQPAREPLTDEQWQIIADTLGCIITREQKDAIEAAHGIKEST